MTTTPHADRPDASWASGDDEARGRATAPSGDRRGDALAGVVDLVGVADLAGVVGLAGVVDLAAIAQSLSGIDADVVRDLDAREASELLAAASAVRSALAALEDRAMVALDVRLREEEAERGVPESRRGRTCAHHISMALRISPAQSSRRLAAARRLVRDMPRMHAALATGRLPEASALAIGTVSGPLGPALRREADAVLDQHLGHLEDASAAQWTQEVDLLAHRLAPDGFATRHAQAKRERSVSIVRAPHGMAHLHATLPGLDAAAIRKRLSLEAERLRAEGDRRGHGQIMADLLADTLLGRDEALEPVRLDVGVIITDRVLLGSDEGGATIEGYGTVPAEAIREAVGERVPREGAGVLPEGVRTTGAGEPRLRSPENAARDSLATLRRLYTHPSSGELVAVESRARAFPRALARMIRMGQVGCAGPYCGAPIRHLDHIWAVADGGATAVSNGQGLCARCNLVKEQVAAVTPAVEDGARVVTWRSVLGRRARRTGTPVEGRHGDSDAEPP